MKKVILLLLVLPLLALGQNTSEYTVFELGMLTANPAHVKQFEAGMAAHNKKYHSDDVYGARIYTINNGPNVGKYIWVMGPLPWSAFDSRPAKEDHDDDWKTNVLAYATADGNQTYWKSEPALSNFSRDFIVKNLLVDFYDVKRFKGKQALEILEKIKKVMSEKFPNEIYGMYTNEFPSTKEGRDILYISFFEKSAWLGQDLEFAKKFDEVHGKGSFETFLKDWEALTDGSETELWTFRPELSGKGSNQKAR